MCVHVSRHQGASAARKYAGAVTSHGPGFFMLNTESTGSWRAHTVVVPRSTSKNALATPTNPSAMSPTQRQPLVEYAAHWGPIVTGIKPESYARRCTELARAAATLKLRVVSGMYQALAARVLTETETGTEI